VTEKALLPNVKPGTVVLCTSTCDPDRIEALGKRLAGTSIRFLETPVSGTSEQVRAGDGVGLIGGDPKTADDAKAVLDALFPRRFHIGKAGDGGRAKLAVNLILGLNRMALAEGLTFAERMGLEPQGVPGCGTRLGVAVAGDGHQGPEDAGPRFCTRGPRQADAQGRAHDARSGRSARPGVADAARALRRA
jgi:3-hydroxyisobutyrate dehydrogenase-like beta-hydroxyacid dehydrogenase